MTKQKAQRLISKEINRMFKTIDKLQRKGYADKSTELIRATTIVALEAIQRGPESINRMASILITYCHEERTLMGGE